MNEPIMQFFAPGTTPLHVEGLARHFRDLAQRIVDSAPRNPEMTVALRKLLEAREAAIRSVHFVFDRAEPTAMVETCPRCEAAAEFDAKHGICSRCDYGNLAPKPKHVERAQLAIAEELCTCYFTDGFCSPSQRPDCRCVKLARGCLQLMESRGVKPVWVFDKSA